MKYPIKISTKYPLLKEIHSSPYLKSLIKKGMYVDIHSDNKDYNMLCIELKMYTLQYNDTFGKWMTSVIDHPDVLTYTDLMYYSYGALQDYDQYGVALGAIPLPKYLKELIHILDGDNTPIELTQLLPNYCPQYAFTWSDTSSVLAALKLIQNKYTHTN